MQEHGEDWNKVVSRAFSDLKDVKNKLKKADEDKKDLKREIGVVEMMRDKYKDKATELQGCAVRLDRMLRVRTPACSVSSPAWLVCYC